MTEATVKQRKVVGRTVAIVLAIVCVILSAGLVVALAVYLPSAGTIDRLNSENAGLKGNMSSVSQQIVNLQNMLSQRDASIADKDAQIADINSAYNEEVNGLLSILYLNATGVPVPNQDFSLAAKENSSVWTGGVDYAGYFIVSVQSSSSTTFAQVIYSFSGGVNFDQTIVVGTSGNAGFPVLPTDNINVIIGNTELVDSVNGTVTVNYYY